MAENGWIVEEGDRVFGTYDLTSDRPHSVRGDVKAINDEGFHIRWGIEGWDRKGIVISKRDTPMGVTEVRTPNLGAVCVEAKNHHGKYYLRGHATGSVPVRPPGRLVSGGVEVEYAE